MIVVYILLALIVLSLMIRLIFYFRYEFPLRKKEQGFEYVYVEEDGSVRELYEDEIEYLSTEYSPADGARPYIKSRYADRTLDNKIHGYIERRRVPSHIEIRKVILSDEDKHDLAHYSHNNSNH